ncbi:Transmembrane emp24 domain-containing protein [Hondaea fermentalgiana]|uniref:Transmembrane emp24 domain-containing protein n=1 Tax=Hondaea fermentalgiana TaxID=2315210 RepID=A0A2R5GEX0_9STRA|nr:Transmembrane emp24 domain-containing protein [Hondaea fermentalgiana]|eukprot:GBG29466.1 Transmembrane emp24 domain-containing protein [Hondaea fermentalgiana]
MRGSYQVIDGGYLDIDLAVIYSRTQKKIVEHFRQEEGNFEFDAAEAGRYKVCFGNKLSTSAAKKVQFSIHAGRVDELLENEATEGLADKLVLSLGRRVSDLKEQEEYLRRRSERHQRTTESTSSRVLLSSLCEAFILVAVNLWQIYYLRRFFEVKRIL